MNISQYLPQFATLLPAGEAVPQGRIRVLFAVDFYLTTLATSIAPTRTGASL